MVGLTSPGNAEFVKQLGCYDTVVSYDDIGLLPETSAVFVDMAGNSAVLSNIHHHYKDNLKYSCLVGGTHWKSVAGGTAIRFLGRSQHCSSAPDHAAERMKEWGPGGFQNRVAESWNKFIPHTKDWVNVCKGEGRAAVEKTYEEVLSGKANPKDGFVLSLKD